MIPDELKRVIAAEKPLVSGWQELDLVKPTIGQKIVYMGNLFPAEGVYVGDDEVRCEDGTIDRFDRWEPA